MNQMFKNLGKGFRIWVFLLLGVILAGWITGIASAQANGLWMYIKEGASNTLTADGKSQTTVMVDLSQCSWYSSSGPGGMIQIEFLNTLGMTASPPSINSTKGELGSPFELTITSGYQSGTGKISATASYCSEGNVMVLGVCSSKEEANNPKCTGEILVTVLSSQSSEESEISEEEGEENQELNASIACTPEDPKVSQSVSCTVSVNGAMEGESLEFLWSLDGAAGSRTKDRVYSWKGEEPGYFDVGVEVYGKDRSAKNNLRVEVREGKLDEEQSPEVDTSGEDVDELRNNLDSFLRAAGLRNIDPARLGGAGAGVATLLTIWMIIQHRSGVPMEKLEQTLGQWRWRKGAKLPEALPVSDHNLTEKTTGMPPDQLPEEVKIKQPKEPPNRLPEQKEDDGKVRVSASAKFDQPAGEGPIPDTQPHPDRAVSGETGEERMERLVDDMEDYRDAVDKTMSTFKKKLEDVPIEVKESKFWKEKVAPKLKKLDEMGIDSKSSKLKEFLRIAKDLLEVRQKVDDDLSFLSKKDREGIVWLERGLQSGEEALRKLHKQWITDPAIKAVKQLLPKDQAEAAEKFLKQHQADIEKMLSGIKKLPRKYAENAMKAQHRDQNVGIIKRDTNKVFQHEGFKDKYPADFGKGWRKAKRANKAVSDAASKTKKWLGKYIWQLRDIPPTP